MLSHLIAGASHHQTCACRDIKRILLVTACAHYVHVAWGVEQSRHTRLKYSVTKSQQFVHCYAPHLQSCQQCRNLFSRILLLSDAYQYVVHLLTRQRFVVQNLFQ